MSDRIEFIQDHENRRRFPKKTIVFLAFALLLAGLVLTSFGNNGSNITGNTVAGGGEVIEFGGISLRAKNLDVPNLTLSGSFSRIEIQGGSSNALLDVGKERFDLSISANGLIILTDFKGKLSFDSGKITGLIGDVGKITINAVPVTPNSGKYVSVDLSGGFDYTSLDIDSGVAIGKLIYLTSGILDIDSRKTILNLDKEVLTIEGFNGGLDISNKKLDLTGKVGKIEVESENSKIIIE